MPIDLNRFIATFFDEAQEHMETLEEMAMALGSGRHDPEVLNSIFRAAHSIKGGSGTFGFTQLAEATHEMEALFDLLRKGQGRADESTVRLLLDACDVFKAHLARLKAGERGTDQAMDGMRAQLVAYRAKFAAVVPAKAGTQPLDSRVRGNDKPTEESFFVPINEKDDGEAYGLFDGAASVPVKAAADKEKYGLFEG